MGTEVFISEIRTKIRKAGVTRFAGPIEFNDSLVLTPEQGFPVSWLDLDAHILNSLRAEDFPNDTDLFFRAKKGVRKYHEPPVRVFLVENRNDKWIYWGLVHVTEFSYYKAGKTL